MNSDTISEFADWIYKNNKDVVIYKKKKRIIAKRNWHKWK